MSEPTQLERQIIDHVKFGALEVINKVLRKTLEAEIPPDKWSAEDKSKYVVAIDVRDEVLKRIEGTFRSRRKKKA
mgnify:CR=1 FL=1